MLNEGDTIEGGTFTATEDDESAVEANGETEASMTGSVIQKTGGTASSAGKSSFESSTFEGCINPDGAAGNVTVTISADSEWILTEDTYISSFTDDLSQVTANGYHLYVNGVQAL